MEVRTTRFGSLQVEPQSILRFIRGFVGFPHWNRFVLLPHGEGSPFGILQSVDDPDLALAVIDPRQIEPAYVAPVRASLLADIGIRSPEEARDAVVLAVVTIPQEVRRATANLMAPLIINPANRLGLQVILEGTPYQVRHPVFPPADRSPAPGSRVAVVGAA